MAASGFTAGGLPMAGGVYYTKERPGRWAKKVASHLPVIKRMGGKIEVTTRHPQDEFQHYIVKHTVLDANFQHVSEVMFDPRKGAPVSSHDIGKLSGTVYVTSMCNIHDVWLNALVL
jgi:superoxide reductase